MLTINNLGHTHAGEYLGMTGHTQRENSSAGNSRIDTIPDTAAHFGHPAEEAPAYTSNYFALGAVGHD